MAETKSPSPIHEEAEGPDLGASYGQLVEEVEIPRVGDEGVEAVSMSQKPAAHSKKASD